MLFVLFKQKTAYEMRIRDWSSDVCSSDLSQRSGGHFSDDALGERARLSRDADQARWPCVPDRFEQSGAGVRTDGPSREDRKSAVWGKRVSVSVDPGGRRIIQKPSRTAT